MPCYFRDMELLTVIHHAYRRRRIMSTTPLKGPVHTWALRQSARSYLTQAATAADRARAQEEVDRVLAVPVTAIVHLDGQPQQDFVKLQLGRAVDPSHLLSLKLQNQLLCSENYLVRGGAWFEGYFMS